MNIKSTKNEDNEELEENALCSGHFKGKCRNYEQIGHKLSQCKHQSSHNVGNNDKTIGGKYCSYCRKPGHVIQKFFKLKKKETRYNHNDGN
jgi:hypothetical protein